MTLHRLLGVCDFRFLLRLAFLFILGWGVFGFLFFDKVITDVVMVGPQEGSSGGHLGEVQQRGCHKHQGEHHKTHPLLPHHGNWEGPKGRD